MRFFVRRASEYSDDNAPCPDATKGDNGAWTVDVADLDALEAFVREHGEVILREPFLQTGDHMELFIYDDYVE